MNLGTINSLCQGVFWKHTYLEERGYIGISVVWSQIVESLECQAKKLNFIWYLIRNCDMMKGVF